VHSLSHTASPSNTLDMPVHVPIKLNSEEGVRKGAMTSVSISAGKVSIALVRGCVDTVAF
jgi:hypothetical protein